MIPGRIVKVGGRIRGTILRLLLPTPLDGWLPLTFDLDTYDATTLRDNPTTQVAIRLREWPGNAFLLWLPESVGALWNQWTPDIAHQDFARTSRGGLRWAYDRHSAALLEAELIPTDDTLLLEVRVSNRSSQPIPEVTAQNCLHLSAAPDFECDDFSRIYLRCDGEWRSLSQLSPTCDLPMYYRPGFHGERGRDSWGGHFAHCNQAANADHPLIVCLSLDGSRSVGTASDDYQCLFHNRRAPYLRCLHSQQAPVPALAPTATAVFRQRIYFVDGGLAKCIAAFERQPTAMPR